MLARLTTVAYTTVYSRIKPLIASLALASAALLPIDAAAIDLRSATVQDINRAFEAGTLTSEELVQRYIARIEAYNEQGPALRAVISIAPNALERARELDEERRRSGPRSPLHGIPIIVKDTVDTVDGANLRRCHRLCQHLPATGCHHHPQGQGRRCHHPRQGQSG